MPKAILKVILIICLIKKFIRNCRGDCWISSYWL